MRALLVEDDAANALVASELLTMSGFLVDIVTTGTEAIEKAISFPYAIIVMDVKTGDGISGIEATRRIREHETRHRKEPTAILCVTANALAGHREEYLTHGITDYLAKPYHVEDFIKKISLLTNNPIDF